jgi:hypothetical protein
MPIQITLDYLEELRSIDPDATISVIIWSKIMKIGKEGTKPIVRDGVHVSNDNAFTMDGSVWLHVTPANRVSVDDAADDSAPPQ